MGVAIVMYTAFGHRAVRPAVTSVTTIPGADKLPSITDNVAERKDDPVSDHAMVAATLEI